MRHFVLQNSAGEEMDITNTDVLFHDIGGIGFKEDTDFRGIGDVWWLNSVSFSQSPITGKICFTEYHNTTPYQKFFKFAKFIQRAPLVLVYYPEGYGDGMTKYNKRVRVTSLEKSELTKYGVLDSSIEFTPYTPWYKVVTGSNEADSSEQSDPESEYGWIWGGSGANPLVFEPENYSHDTVTKAHFRGESIEFVRLVSDTSNKNPIKLTIQGPVTNPSWTHYVDGTRIATGGFDTGQTVQVLEDESLVIDNTYGMNTIKVIANDSGNELRDVYALRNFNLDCFFSLREGTNRFVISSTSGTVNNISIEGHIYYATV